MATKLEWTVAIAMTATAGVIIGPSNPALGEHMRSIKALAPHRPNMKCGTGGLFWAYSLKNSPKLASNLHKELLSDGWTHGRHNGRDTYRVKKGWLYPLRGYASVQLGYPDPGEMRVSVQFSAQRMF